MATLPSSPLISVDEYLNTSYEPDMEYVDGVLVERRVGDWLHSLVQSNILFFLRQKFSHLKMVAELRNRVTDTRFRLPDVCAVLATPQTRYLLEPAYLVVEVLSPDDQMSAVIEKLREYDRKGVANIWVIDPRLQTMSVYRHPMLRQIDAERIVTCDQLVWLSRSEIFNQ